MNTGNGNIQTGNGIISLTSLARIKKLPLQNVSNYYYLSNLKLVLKTGNRIILTGNGIISPTSWAQIKKLLLENVSNLY